MAGQSAHGNAINIGGLYEFSNLVILVPNLSCAPQGHWRFGRSVA
jgi:hypothetical protein